jgi:hypothetical protein
LNSKSATAYWKDGTWFARNSHRVKPVAADKNTSAAEDAVEKQEKGMRGSGADAAGDSGILLGNG